MRKAGSDTDGNRQTDQRSYGTHDRVGYATSMLTHFPFSLLENHLIT